MKKMMSFVLCLVVAFVMAACFEKKQTVDANATLKSESAVKEVVVKQKVDKKVEKKKVVKVKAE